MKKRKSGAAQRERQRKRNILAAAGLDPRRSHTTVTVVCHQCGRHIISDAAPGEAWPAIAYLAPHVQVGFDTPAVWERAAALPGGRWVSPHGALSGESLRGLWVPSIPFAVAGARPRTDRWTLPHPAGVNGDATDWCVVGQPTIISHRCRSESVTIPSTLTVELFDLVLEVERAIRAGQDTVRTLPIWHRTNGGEGG